MRAILIKQEIIGHVDDTPLVNERIEVVMPKGKDFTLEEMYALIDCGTVEHIELAKGVHMWIDENGKSENKPFNEKATHYFHRSELYKPELYRKAGIPVDFIVGNALIIDNTKKGWL